MVSDTTTDRIIPTDDDAVTWDRDKDAITTGDEDVVTPAETDEDAVVTGDEDVVIAAEIEDIVVSGTSNAEGSMARSSRIRQNRDGCQTMFVEINVMKKKMRLTWL